MFRRSLQSKSSDYRKKSNNVFETEGNGYVTEQKEEQNSRNGRVNAIERRRSSEICSSTNSNLPTPSSVPSFPLSLFEAKNRRAETRKSNKRFLPVQGFESPSIRETDFPPLEGKTGNEVTDKYLFNSTKLTAARKLSLLKLESSSSLFPIPPQSREDCGKLTVVLDIDETLVHSEICGSPKRIDPRQRARQDQLNGSFYTGEHTSESFILNLADGDKVVVYKRPGLDSFLKRVSKKYEIMAYTAGIEAYAGRLLDWLDPEGKIFKYRLYRDSCLYVNQYYLKDLQKVNRDLKRTVLVDNNMICFLPQVANGVPIESFYFNPNDKALLTLESFLDHLDGFEDVRECLATRFNLTTLLDKQRKLVLG